MMFVADPKTAEKTKIGASPLFRTVDLNDEMKL